MMQFCSFGTAYIDPLSAQALMFLTYCYCDSLLIFHYL